MFNLFCETTSFGWHKNEEGGYVYEVELPGVAIDAVSVEVVSERFISVDYTDRWKRTGRFFVRAPLGMDLNSLEAELKDGILALTSKEEKKSKRKIDVK